MWRDIRASVGGVSGALAWVASQKEYKCHLKQCLNNQFKNQWLGVINSSESTVDAKIFEGRFAY